MKASNNRCLVPHSLYVPPFSVTALLKSLTTLYSNNFHHPPRKFPPTHVLYRNRGVLCIETRANPAASPSIPSSPSPRRHWHGPAISRDLPPSTSTAPTVSQPSL